MRGEKKPKTVGGRVSALERKVAELEQVVISVLKRNDELMQLFREATKK